MESRLIHPYTSISYNGILSFGGSQRRSQKRIMRSCGCGVIACADLLLYLGAYKPDCKRIGTVSMPISAEDYESFTNRLRREHFPLIPRFGTSGLALAWGLGRYFKKHRIRLKARWGVKKKDFCRCIREMLSADLPVILSIGNNFPLFWRRKKLMLYRLTDKGYVAAASTKAHFVTVTGMDEEWLHISSWGQAYSIRISEYTDYVSRCSSWAISNIVYLRRK